MRILTPPATVLTTYQRHAWLHTIVPGDKRAFIWRDNGDTVSVGDMTQSSLDVGDSFRFEIRMNTVKVLSNRVQNSARISLGRYAQLRRLNLDDLIEEWFRSRMEAFELDGVSWSAEYWMSPKPRARISVMDFTGQLKVLDAAKANDIVRYGLGRARAWGMGMLVLHGD